MQPNDPQLGVPPTPETPSTGAPTPSSTPTPVTPAPAVAPAPSTPVEPTPAPVTPADASTGPVIEPTSNPFSFGSSQGTETPVSPAPTPAAPKNKKKLLLIIAIVVAALLIGGGVFAYTALSGNKGASDSSTKTTDDAQADTNGGGKETLTRTDGTVDLSSTVNGDDSIKAQDVSVGLNEQVNLSNGLSIMVTKVERNFTGFNAKYLKVPADSEVVAVTLTVGTRNTEGNGFVKSAMLMHAPSESEITPEFVSSLAEVEGALDTGAGLEQGQQTSGKVLYIVKKGESPLSLHYERSYRNTATDETVVLSATFKL